MTVPLYAYDLSFLGLAPERWILKLETDGLAKVVRHKKGRISRAVMHKHASQPDAPTVRDYMGKAYSFHQDLGDGHRPWAMKPLAGYATNEAYQWARRQGNRVLVVKGDSRAPAILGAASPIEVGPLGVKLRRGVKIWPVNSGMAKEELYRWLRLDSPTDEDLAQGLPFPPGYCHFPRYSEEYFRQITSEQLVTKLVKGYRKLEWQKMRDRNEALDCRVYARAAAARVGLDRFQEKHWRAVAERMGLSVQAQRPATTHPPFPAPAPASAPAAPPRRGRRVSGRFGR